MVAVGETGLDYYYEHSPAEVQQRHLRRFVREAGRAGLPLVIHCRDAFPDLLRIFAEEDAAAVGGVIHCFSGTPDEAEACLALGFALSFSGIVTFKTAESLARGGAAHAARPHPDRDRRALPRAASRTAASATSRRWCGTSPRRSRASTGRDLAEIAAVTVANTERAFRLPPAVG